MKQLKYITLLATVFAPMAALADSVEGVLKQYERGKQITIQVKGKSKTFLITTKTNFFDQTGREWPEMADPKDRIWKISATVTVTFHTKSGGQIADAVTFPYGKVPPELMGKGIDPPKGNIEVPPGAPPELAIKVGDRLPAFTLTTFSGRKLTNASIAGKVTVLDFWATWCGPCKLITPVMQKLHDKFKSSGVLIIGANCHEGSANGLAKDYVKAHGYTFPFAFANPLAQKLKVTAIPLVLVIDKQGVVRHIQAGYEDGCAQQLESVIKSLLEKQ